MWENDKYRLCRRLKPEGTVDTENLGHIQCHCPVLQRPRIAVHHGIWRELNVAISQWSKEKNKNDDNLKWYFLSAISESDYCEWTFRRIMDHLGLFTELNGWSDEEFTHPMDSSEGPPEVPEDWAEKKGLHQEPEIRAPQSLPRGVQHSQTE